MNSHPKEVSYDIGVDIGGTFTDIVCRAPDGSVRLVKIPTAHRDPGAGVRATIEHLRDVWGIEPAAITRFVHGTTVATNAVIERKGAHIGLITTEGFADVLELGRQSRKRMYDLALDPEAPVFLAPGARRREVRERIGPDGKVITPLDRDGVLVAASELVDMGVEAIAICFLFSFLNAEHERTARELIGGAYPGLMVSLSSEVDPAFREYERTVVTGFDAYLKPVLNRYLTAMEQTLERNGVTAPLQIMQSRGGICSSAVARQRPVRLFLSGPAAGVIGAQQAGNQEEFNDLITMDIGGTSCDIAVVREGKPLVRTEGEIDGYPVRVPMVDVNAIGAGGGSIAWIDAGASLRVGPHSAGSEPGPACYARGGQEPTVTDASVVLGYLDPGYFAGGGLTLDKSLAREVIESRLAKPLGLSLDEAALGIHRVVNAQMVEGIRLVSVRRGYDPRDFALVALGGGGAVHATAIASQLGIRLVVVPRFPGVLSANGLLSAAIEHEASVAFPHELAELSLNDVRPVLDELDDRCTALMAHENVEGETPEIERFADVCYVGQSYHLEVSLLLDKSSDPIAKLYEDFRTAHDVIYGHAGEGPARIVNLRAVHRVTRRMAHGEGHSAGTTSIKARRTILIGSGERVQAMVYDREGLKVGDELPGPAIVEQADTTLLIEPGWTARVSRHSALILTKH